MSICKNRVCSKKGAYVSSKKSGKYYERTNIIAGYVNNKSIAPMILMVHVIQDYLRLRCSRY
ncbi:putative transposase [Orientia tsutsugamushi str. TA716]|nr:putative transposase [Orientia tsutsugamushi str. TA716]